MDLPDPEYCLEVNMTNPTRTCIVCEEGFIEEGGVCVVPPTPQECDTTAAVDSYGDDCGLYRGNEDWCGR